MAKKRSKMAKKGRFSAVFDPYFYQKSKCTFFARIHRLELIFRIWRLNCHPPLWAA